MMKRIAALTLALALISTPVISATLMLPSPPDMASEIIYHGNTQSKILHEPECRYYNCKACTRKFASKEAAIKAGYRGCKVCKP